MLPEKFFLTCYLIAFAMQGILCVVLNKVFHSASFLWLISCWFLPASDVQCDVTVVCVYMSRCNRSLSVSLVVCLHHMSSSSVSVSMWQQTCHNG